MDLYRVIRSGLLSLLLGMIVLGIPVRSGAFDGMQQAVAGKTGDVDIASIEAYLNSVRTLQSSFVQTASNGHVAEGTLYLARPGKLRIDYKPPMPLQIFGDSLWLILVDSELKEVNQLPIAATPAALLLKDEIILSGDIEVSRAHRQNGLIQLHLSQTNEPDAGRLLLAIAEKPLRLRGWTVIDAQGTETTVTLIGPRINEAIANRVFVFDRPDWADEDQE